MAGVHSQSFCTPNHNLETFSLVWLDARVNTKEDNRKTQQQLRQIINYLITFDDEHQCQQYISSHSFDDRLVLIVSGQYGRQLVPRIHQLRQLSAIYVYCMDKKANEQWANHFTKVKSVIVRSSDLVGQIKADQKSRTRTEEPLSFKKFTTNSNLDQTTTRLNGHFVHYLLLIDVLLRMKSTETDKQSLITLCKKEYQNNNTQLAIIREFEREYIAEKALWWYTRDSFLSNMLNKALRIQNIDLLFLFRFVIGDIYRQLKQNQCQSSVRVYRGQGMSQDEINALRQFNGDFISINSFFSTSMNRHKVLKFFKSTSNESSGKLHSVLFVIDADPSMVRSKPFADIRSLSEYSDECEILFMIGCIFRLTNIHYSKNEDIWMFHMQLWGDDEHELRRLFDHMKNKYAAEDKQVSLLGFGDVLRDMGKFDLAEEMYNRLLNELPSNDPSLSDLYRSLGTVIKDKGDYNSSLHCFSKSLEIKMRTNPHDYVSIGALYNLTGETYRRKNDEKTALRYYNKAVALFQKAHDEHHPHMAAFYNNIALVYDNEKNYFKALAYYRKSSDIDEKHLPYDHPDRAMSYNNTGCVYEALEEYDLAMKCHKRALEIRLKALPPQHPDIAMSYHSIGAVHEKKCEWQRALMNYQEAATIYQHSLSPQHPDVIQINKDIQRVSL